MKSLKIIFLVMLFLIFFPSNSLFAIPDDHWVDGPVKVFRDQGNRVLIKTKSMINPDNCSDPSHYYLAMTGSEKERRYRQDVRDAYIAYQEFSLGMTPGIVFNPRIGLYGCSGGGGTGFPIIYEVFAD